MIRIAILLGLIGVLLGGMGWRIYGGCRAAFGVPDGTLQLVVGTSASWSSTAAEIRRFERDAPGKPWRQVGPTVLANIGRNGLALGRGLWPHPGWLPRWMPDVGWKKEGDGKSPAGAFPLDGRQWGYGEGWREELGGKLDRLRLETRTDLVCVDDVDSACYNYIVAPHMNPSCGWKTAEQLRRDDALYSRLLVIQHNGTNGNGPSAIVPGAGSCTFFHVSRGSSQPTAGCTSMPIGEMDRLLDWLEPGKHPLYILLPAAEYRSLWLDHFRLISPGLPRIQ